METRIKVYIVFVILFALTSVYLYYSQPLNERLGLDEDTLYRFVVRDEYNDNKVVHISKNYTWAELEREGFVVNGQPRTDEHFWDSYCNKHHLSEKMDGKPTGRYEHKPVYSFGLVYPKLFMIEEYKYNVEFQAFY